MSTADELTKLNDLRVKGLITDEEYEAQKARLLSGSLPPSGAGQIPQGAVPPPNHLVGAILVTLFCCLPLGIVAIIKSSNVTAAFARGALAEAEAASKEAQAWIKYTIFAGIAVVILYSVYAFLFLGSFKKALKILG
jgi:hypothetical protein